MSGLLQEVSDPTPNGSVGEILTPHTRTCVPKVREIVTPYSQVEAGLGGESTSEWVITSLRSLGECKVQYLYNRSCPYLVQGLLKP